MEGDNLINILDIGIIMILIMFIIIGFKRGVIKEVVSLVGIIIVFILSWSLKNILGNFLCIIFPFFDFIGILDGMSSLNILFYQAIAFMIIFCLLLSIYTISLKISRFVQKIVNMTIILWLPSKVLGGIASFVKGYLLMVICFIFIVIPFGDIGIFKESKIMNFMLYETPIVSGYTHNFMYSVERTYELANNISNGSISVNEANQEAIEIMIDYNVTNKSTVNDLIDLNKIKNVRKF